MTTTYIDKNKSYRTNGNEDIDKLLYMMDVTSVLSDTFKQKIVSLCGWILTNNENYIEDIKKEIESLKTEMKWLNIFSDHFTDEINNLLMKGLEFQIIQKESKKFNL